MSRKKEAFELFDQGKRPSSQELKDLIPNSRTRYNYFQEWKRLRFETRLKVEHKVVPKKQEPTIPTNGIIHPDINQEKPITTCRITPIMTTARHAVIEEWGWGKDLPMEDIIDTIVCLCLRDRNIVIHDYSYVVKIVCKEDTRSPREMIE